MWVFWVISTIGLLIALFGGYGSMSKNVYIEFADYLPVITRDTFFFTVVGVTSLSFLVLGWWYWIIPYIPSKYYLVPSKEFWFDHAAARRAFNRIIQSWILAIACIINYFIMISVMMIARANDLDGNLGYIKAEWWYYGLAILPLLFLPWFRLAIKKHNLLANEIK